MVEEKVGLRVDRIECIDALRGFALLGIFLANILYWSGWILITEQQRLALGGESGMLWQNRFHHIFIDGKFYTLFSLLFGAGFALQLERLTRRGADGLRIYRRRILILLTIGLVHSWLIWDGDILTLYALLGLVLPLFHGLSARALIVAALILIFIVPSAGMAAFGALGWEPHKHLMAWSFGISETLGGLGADDDPAKVLGWLRSEDFDLWLAWALSGTPFSWGIRLESWRIPKVLGIMLLGMVAGRRLAAGDLLTDRRLLRRLLVGGLAVGVPVSFAYALLPSLGQTDWPSLVGTVPMAIAYASGFALAWPWASKWLGLFAAPGRMALTNYLAQSVVAGLLFYGIGFGLIGHLRPPAFYAVAVLIFALQVMASRWWLRHHAQGPMEALWRRWTYGRQRPAQTLAAN